MTKGSLGHRGSNGALQSSGKYPLIARRPSSKTLSCSRDKEKVLSIICRYLGRKNVAMLLLVGLALIVFVAGSFSVSKDSTTSPVRGPSQTLSLIGEFRERYQIKASSPPPSYQMKLTVGNPHPCHKFSFPPPPQDRRRRGPRPCPVCYIPPGKARASMPKSSSESPVLRNLTYVVDEYPTKIEPHGGSDFGGYPSLKQRADSFDIKESMEVHCGFVKGRPGHHTGFDIDDADLMDLEKTYDVVVASAIFGNYDLIQQPMNISTEARERIPFFMFIDEETETYMRNTTVLNETMKVGIWKVIVVHNIPYTDSRRNGKVPKLLLHRILPNVRYSIWIDGKLQLVVDPYQLLERFLWRENANFAISRHYRRFDVFEEAEANKAAGKYSNSSIDYQIEFYKKEGLTPYTRAKLPITSDVPEGCVIIREHVPITNLFTCLWFNEVDRFTSRDQLSFSTVRDKIMAKVNWSVNMFLDCERRNFVIQAYHRELLERMPPPAPPAIRRAPLRPQSISVSARRNPSKGSRRGNRKSKRNRKVAAGNRDGQALSE